MSGLGQKQICAVHKPMSAKCQERTFPRRAVMTQACIGIARPRSSSYCVRPSVTSSKQLNPPLIADIPMPEDSSKILRASRTMPSAREFGTADDSHGRHKRNKPVTAKTYRSAVNAAGSTVRPRDICICPPSGGGHLSISRFRNCRLVSHHRRHYRHLREPRGRGRDGDLLCR